MTAGDNPRALIVVTNHGQLGRTGKETGYYLREVSYPHKVLTEAGYEVDFVSPKGGADHVRGSIRDDHVAVRDNETALTLFIRNHFGSLKGFGKFSEHVFGGPRR